MLKKALRLIRLRLTRDPRAIAEQHRANGVQMGHGCTIFGGVGFGSEPYLVKLGDNVRITARTQFVTHDGGVHVLRRLPGFERADVFGPIEVGDNVFIGIASIIMPGVHIGSNVVIGAGSVVTRDIPSNTVAAGVPCRPIRSLGEYRDRTAKVMVPTKGLSANAKRQYLREHGPSSAGHL